VKISVPVRKSARCPNKLFCGLANQSHTETMISGVLKNPAFVAKSAENTGELRIQDTRRQSIVAATPELP